jgi:S-adenosyl-L-methionine hydrolase (adenosine-forming)
VVVEADGQWFVGPDNGLFSVVAARAAHSRAWRIMWRPADLSASFHGRDLFAPMAAWVSKGSLPADKLAETAGLDVQLNADDLAEVIYIDHYGNVLTGLHSQALSRNARVRIGASEVAFARTFAEAPAGAGFWYGNSIGLLEVAVNRGHAASQLGIRVGDRVQVIEL